MEAGSEELSPQKTSAIVSRPSGTNVPLSNLPEPETTMHPNVLSPQGSSAADLEVPETSSEPFVKVRAMKNHTCFIGDRQYRFVKDKSYRVRATVAQVLGNGNVIYPVQYTF